jgi:hypothetical protein
MTETTGRLEAFGQAATTARVKVIARPPSWRATRAILSAVLGLGAAPVVFLLPPHVPWALASIGCGIFFARRFARESTTLVSLEGTCPKCTSPVLVERAVALRIPHELSCVACLQGLLLVGVGEA